MKKTQIHIKEVFTRKNADKNIKAKKKSAQHEINVTVMLYVCQILVSLILFVFIGFDYVRYKTAYGTLGMELLIFVLAGFVVRWQTMNAKQYVFDVEVFKKIQQLRIYPIMLFTFMLLSIVFPADSFKNFMDMFRSTIMGLLVFTQIKDVYETHILIREKQVLEEENRVDGVDS
ncbi:hypothetical protein [Bifidobacterium sp. ESL0704]|uniref:hypothetical protein n=1 Tax=Bifidobacterium sp. ESL0704 TaxID=2983219 RepID=UPI0023FA037E|nr:hypothetical protein [Bifidobacterium sp. ESL0704]WEV52241.1 hypothetical protein OZX64_04820 [Bifidobacterium sp. ESL0704]